MIQPPSSTVNEPDPEFACKEEKREHKDHLLKSLSTSCAGELTDSNPPAIGTQVELPTVDGPGGLGIKQNRTSAMDEDLPLTKESESSLAPSPDNHQSVTKSEEHTDNRTSVSDSKITEEVQDMQNSKDADGLHDDSKITNDDHDKKSDCTKTSYTDKTEQYALESCAGKV